jgi:hypothetical protein
MALSWEFRPFVTLQVIWDIMRCWVKQTPVRILDKESYQAKILAVEPALQARFSNAKSIVSKARAKRKPRFVQNPQNWGPRPKHGRPMLPHEREEADTGLEPSAEVLQESPEEKMDKL